MFTIPLTTNHALITTFGSSMYYDWYLRDICTLVLFKILVLLVSCRSRRSTVKYNYLRNVMKMRMC